MGLEAGNQYAFDSARNSVFDGHERLGRYLVLSHEELLLTTVVGVIGMATCRSTVDDIGKSTASLGGGIKPWIQEP